jgi:Protein of unknown function (DUF3047)
MDCFDKKLIFLCMLGLFFSVNSAFAENDGSKNVVGNFSSGSLSEWKNKEFKGQTKYQLIKLDGLMVLEAESNASASGLIYQKRIDITKTPILNWRWRIEKPLITPNESVKSGDDFAARVYVVVSGGLVFWNTKSINYVWASAMPKDKTWPNPYAGDNVMMLAMRSTPDKTGIWYAEKRNIRDDFKNILGEDVQSIDAVAIMTDSDDTQGKAKAYYGDIFFTAD